MQQTTVVGIIAGILTAISLVPQLVKLLKEKDGEHISVLMLLTLLAGLGAWVYYGVLKKDWPIIVTNGFSFCVNSAIIVCRLRYSHKRT